MRTSLAHPARSERRGFVAVVGAHLDGAALVSRLQAVGRKTYLSLDLPQFRNILLYQIVRERDGCVLRELEFSR